MKKKAFNAPKFDIILILSFTILYKNKWAFTSLWGLYYKHTTVS